MRPEEILGKTVLVGLTYVTADGTLRERRQLHGVVVAADAEHGVEIREPSGDVFTLPPAFDSFDLAEPGEYRLHATGEVVSNPDLLCSWTITEPPAEPSTVVDWLDYYVEQHGLYEAFAARLEDLLSTLVQDRGLDHAWVITFDVDRDDLRRQLLDAWREGEPIGNPFDSRRRAVGLTIAFFSPSGLEELEELVEAEFVVDRAASTSLAEAQARAASDDAVGAIAYELPSYLIELDERRAELPEWSAYAGLKLRIDATTELHDAWRHVLDELPFRHPSSYPTELRDLLSRLSSSLQDADAEIELAQASVDRLLDEYREAVASGELDLPLNGITLLAYLHASELVQSLVELAAELGLRHDPDDWPSWDDVEDGLLWLLQRSGMQSLSELDGFLRTVLARARELLARFLELSADSGYTPWTSRQDIVAWLWLVFRRADGDTVALMHYRHELEKALNTLIGNPVASREAHG